MKKRSKFQKKGENEEEGKKMKRDLQACTRTHPKPETETLNKIYQY
jgi:hypothetical protein